MPPYFIGLMSGTSIDAIDAALISFNAGKLQLHHTYRHAFPSVVRSELLTISQESREFTPLHRIAFLDIQLAKLYSEVVLKLLRQANLSPSKITAIGCHGQTIVHSPDSNPPYTWQLGDPNTLAELTGITTVADFRRRDLAAGGQGAPLAPACHQALFQTPTENRIVLNIGGIANITVLPAETQQPVVGFDTGVGNALLDAWCLKHQQQICDYEGKWAKSGTVQTQLLNDLIKDSYFSRTAPKSTGRDYFNINWLNSYLGLQNYRLEDVQATLVALTVESIAAAARPYHPQRLIVCGGGVHNPLLMQGLAQSLPNCSVESSIAFGIHPDWIEAICFAWLARQTLTRQTGNLPSVTGARSPVILGGIYYGR
ncbi:MAG: anhydro-N-acetylmuramic acid kinase [Thiotrichaceae bacterium]|nr:anhydro-N-acetylmuramic acid kinase [Thiotrichaceae bacterium]